jgi:hypothetical protein
LNGFWPSGLKFQEIPVINKDFWQRKWNVFDLLLLNFQCHLKSNFISCDVVIQYLLINDYLILRKVLRFELKTSLYKSIRLDCVLWLVKASKKSQATDVISNTVYIYTAQLIVTGYHIYYCILLRIRLKLKGNCYNCTSY